MFILRQQLAIASLLTVAFTTTDAATSAATTSTTNNNINNDNINGEVTQQVSRLIYLLGFKAVVLNRCSTEPQGFGEPASGVRQRSSEI